MIFLKKDKYLLIIILIISFILRIVNLDKIPPSLNWDEVSHGYNAYSILKTGRDEWGNFMPSIFRCFGDYKLPVYIYLSVPSVLLLGLNSFAVRLVSILAGSLIPLVVYLILKKIFLNNLKLPLLGASIISFSPGTIFLSRIALEANLFLLLFCLSIYFLIQKKYPLSTFIYGVTLFTYNSSRVILPLYFVLLIYLLVKDKVKIFNSFYKFIPFIFLTALTVFQTLNQSGQARYQWVSLLDQGSINKINELRQSYPRLIINKVTYFTYTATKNYLSHFTPNFIFLNGGSHYQFSLPNFFLISPFFIPFSIFGLYYLIKNIQQKNNQILLFWLLIAPLPSSITRDAPHVLRSISILPVIVILITIGINFIYKKNPKIVTCFVFFVLIVGQILFWPSYKSYATQYSSSWQYGYQDMVAFIQKNYQNYDQFIVTKKYGEPHEFLLFYWPWDPSKYQNDSNKIWDFHANWYWINGFDKFKFVNDWEIKEYILNINPTNNTLLITSPNNYNQGNHLINTIKFLDNTPAFDILEI